MGNCGCGGRNSLLVINSKVKQYPKAVYIPIPIDLDNNPYSDLIPVLSMDLEYCERYNIGIFFNVNNDENKNIFYQTFKKECEKTFKELMSLTEYDSFIKKTFPKDVYYDDIEKFINSRNINKIDSLSEEEINNYLIYCNNNIFRIGLYNKKLKEIELTSNFLREHPKKEEISEENILKSKRIIELDVYRTYPSLPISTNNIYSCNFHSILYEITLRNQILNYYQGMNFIGGFILMFFGNEREISFYYFTKIFCLKSKIYNLAFEEIFIHDFNLLNKYFSLFNEKLKQFFPKISEVLKNIDIIEYVWIGKWFQLLFLTNFTFELVLKFWDIILAKGLDYMIGISLAICEVLQEKIEKCEDIISFNEVIYNGKVKLNKDEEKKLYKVILNDINTNKYNLL